MSVCAAPACSHQSFDGSSYYVDVENTWGVDVNNAWPFTCKASCLKKIELRPLISGFDFALLEVRNLCVASRLLMIHQGI